MSYHIFHHTIHNYVYRRTNLVPFQWTAMDTLLIYIRDSQLLVQWAKASLGFGPLGIRPRKWCRSTQSYICTSEVHACETIPSSLCHCRQSAKPEWFWTAFIQAKISQMGGPPFRPILVYTLITRFINLNKLLVYQYIMTKQISNQCHILRLEYNHFLELSCQSQFGLLNFICFIE